MKFSPNSVSCSCDLVWMHLHHHCKMSSVPCNACVPIIMVVCMTGVGGGALSATPVWVDANGMATDDSTLQLDTLRDILLGKKIHLASSGALRSEKSLSSVSSRPSLAGPALGRPDSVLALVH